MSWLFFASQVYSGVARGKLLTRGADADRAAGPAYFWVMFVLYALGLILVTYAIFRAARLQSG